MAEMEFVSLLKSVLRLQAELPRIEAVQLESMGLTRATLLSLHHYAGTADQSCDDGSHDLDDMFCSACMLAVCGWAASSSVGGSQLRCRYCNRTAGLWNYHIHSSPSLPGVCDESHDNGNSLSPGGDTCGTQSKSHDSSSGSPAGGTACCPTPESSDVLDRSVEDADKHSTGSGSQEEDISGKGMSSPADDARDEENQEEHSADESECKDVGKGGKSTVGEGDEPMEVDNLGADKDETGQRTTVDSSEKGSPTGQQSSDSGQNGMISHTEEEVEPAAKRRRIMKPTRATFDPVAEHHTWCPWVLPDVPTDRLHDTLTVGDENRQPGWRRFLEMLTPADSQQSHSLISIVKTSPPCVGLRSIRKLFLGWTKLATPDS
ncbi:hypothetical protein NP493_1318g00040 [Ridgeia piscesae]|uniref:NuBaID C-terminal domain-containing protein n=1 Tax=Ridgeia piscesae TaxID=27915 RepID=A0AAD9K859_RIDPI|nr:hypothetical protein NP493_1318g00040 [Ridgeia piscesae]